MGPTAHVVRNAFARFIDPDRYVARDEMGGRREADRPTAYDNDRQLIHRHAGSLSFFAGGLAQVASTPLQQFSER